MPLDPATASALTLVALFGVLVLTVVCVVLALRLRVLHRRLHVAFPAGVDDVVDVLVRHANAIDGMREDVATVHSNAERLVERFADAISQVGMVRYDAFEDTGGAQSFSAAMLDRHGNGLVISAINGRSDTRCYGKEIVGGESPHTLSDEERAAIRAAVDGRPVRTVVRSKRRRRAS